MKRHEDNFIITILLLLLTVLMGECLLKLVDIKNILLAQFDYQAEMQFCMQEAIEYLAPCHVERDEDGSYNWYWSPEEGRK